MMHGTMTGAAQALGITQPAISRLIGDLEFETKFSLFERHGSRLLPTPDATEFYGEVERLYYGLERLEQVAREIHLLRRAALRLTTIPMITFTILPAVLGEFVAGNAGVRVTHDVNGSPQVVDLVASRQFEIGISQTGLERADVEVVASFGTDCVCVMPPDHRLAHRSSLGPRDLAEIPLVALTHHSMTASLMRRAFAEANIVPLVAVESQPSYSACGLAASGVGVAIVDPLTPQVFGDRLAVIPLEPALPFDFHIIRPAGVTPSRTSTAFTDILFRHLEASPAVRRISPPGG